MVQREAQEEMEQIGRWVPGNAPLDEGYWEALLRDGENGSAAPPAASRDKPYLDGTRLLRQGRHRVKKDPWQQACELMEQREIIELPVVGCNRGGVLVAWNGLQGFVPASHLTSLPPFSGRDERYDELKKLVGSRLNLKIIELDPQRGRLVLSERASHLDESHRQELLDSLCPGDICEGRVTNLCSFGAFVDLGGIEGLIHVSELSWERIEHPSDMLDPGQKVDVYVLNVDRDRGRIGLSIKRLQPDPWLTVEERYRVGQAVRGVITHVVDFGAFVRVEEGLEGLVHVSELAKGDFTHPRDIVQEDDVVIARVLNIDGERRRMGLSLRRVKEPVAKAEEGSV